MIIFRDYYNNEVTLSFADHPFSKEPKHVWAICKLNGQWLLTKHKDRGLEFPGGKVEPGETAKDAAIREIREETGGIVESLSYVGQYFVAGKGGNIVKNIYLANVSELVVQQTYYETDGPVLLKEIPADVKQNQAFSFIMKDGVLANCLRRIN